MTPLHLAYVLGFAYGFAAATLFALLVMRAGLLEFRAALKGTEDRDG